jgi:ABC-type branched-subunit amino acid transport system permease subunit
VIELNPSLKSSMLSTCLQKGAIYALVAVSMNLLNGFTGLFSLGQAGFMLLGACTYGILTIPQSSRASVFKYYDGGIVQFEVPVLVGILLAVLAVFGVGEVLDLSGVLNLPVWASNLGSLVVFGLVILSLLCFTVLKKNKK